MKNRSAFLSIILICLGSVAVSGQQIGISSPARFASNPIRQDEEKASVEDLVDELDRLKLRIRELEYDFEDKDKGSKGDAQDFESFTEKTTSQLESLSETVEGLGESVEEIDGKLPDLISHKGAGKRFQLYGRIHLAYYAFSDVEGVESLFGEDPQDRFGFRRLRLSARGDISDNIFYQIQTEFADANDFQFRDAWFGFRDLPIFNNVLIGNHKRPYNLDQLNSSNHNVFLDRAFLADAINDGNRRLGISSNGNTENLFANWRYGLYNMENVQDDGLFIGDNYQPEVAGRLALMPWYDESSGGRGYLHTAVSAAARFPDGFGPNNQSEYSTNPEALFGNIFATGPIFGAETENLWGLEAALNIGAWQFVAEYGETFVDRAESVGPNLNFHGGYMQAAYMLTGEHMPWNRSKGIQGRPVPFENFFSVRDCNGSVRRGLGAWQVAARYSYIDLNDEDIQAGAAESLTLGLNWYWNPYSRLQLNYTTGDVNNEPIVEGTYDLWGLQFEIYF